MARVEGFYTNEFFKAAELKCPTSGDVVLAPGFLDKLIEFRKRLNKPMIINSACRSNAHNEWLLSRGYKASRNSFHLINNRKYQTGGSCAVDVKATSPEFRRELILMAQSLDWSVGIAETFIHIDRRVDYTRLSRATFFY